MADVWGDSTDSAIAAQDLSELYALIKDCYYLDSVGRSRIQQLASGLAPLDRRLIYDTYSQYGPDGIFAKARLNPFPKYGVTQERLAYWSIGAALLVLGGTADYYASSHDSGEARIVNPWLFGTAVGLLVADMGYLVIGGGMLNRSEDSLFRSSLLLGGTD